MSLDEFDPEAHPSLISQLLVAVGVKKDPLQVLPEERVLKAFREKLQVYQVESSRVITVEFSSQDPKLAAAIPNEMMKAYIALQSGAKLDTSTEAARWLEPEIASLREKVRDADRKVADYRASSDLLSAGQGETLATRQAQRYLHRTWPYPRRARQCGGAGGRRAQRACYRPSA